MLLDWGDFSSDSAVEDTALLVSIRTQSLLLTALAKIQRRYNWLEVDDATWDDIDGAISQATNEVMRIMAVDSTPVGAIMAWWTDTPPDKWMFCSGDMIATIDYPELAAVIGDTGGLVVLPDFSDRFLFGSSPVGAGLRSLGGENYHILTEAEMPLHNHTIPAHSHTFGTSSGQGSRTDRVQRGDLTSLLTQTTDTEPATDTGDSGGNVAHNNMPEYVTVNWIIKVLP
jgi:microcystin-dependent protein